SSSSSKKIRARHAFLGNSCLARISKKSVPGTNFGWLAEEVRLRGRREPQQAARYREVDPAFGDMQPGRIERAAIAVELAGMLERVGDPFRTRPRRRLVVDHDEAAV